MHQLAAVATALHTTRIASTVAARLTDVAFQSRRLSDLVDLHQRRLANLAEHSGQDLGRRRSEARKRYSSYKLGQKIVRNISRHILLRRKLDGLNRLCAYTSVCNYRGNIMTIAQVN